MPRTITNLTVDVRIDVAGEAEAIRHELRLQPGETLRELLDRVDEALRRQLDGRTALEIGGWS